MSIKTNYEDIRELERNLFILDERLSEAEDRPGSKPNNTGQICRLFKDTIHKEL